MEKDSELSQDGVEVSTTVQEAVAALHTDLDQLVEVVAGRLRTRLPSYAAVPPGLLKLRVRRALAGGISAVRRLAQLPGTDPDFGQRGGWPPEYAPRVEDVIAAYRIGVDTVWSRFQAEMAKRQAPAEELLAVGESVWAWAGAITVHLVRRANGDGQRADRRREAYVRTLLLDPAAASADGDGLDQAAVRLPFRARSASGGTVPAEVVELLRPWLAVDTTGGALVTVVDGDVAGLLVARPCGLRRHLVVGLGAGVEPYRLAAEFTQATQALTTAVGFGLVGVFTREELGLRAAVVSAPALGRQLVEQRLAPLRERGEEGAQLEEAVAAYLRYGMRVEAAARTLFVHPNTLRNRLRRFEEATGTSLRDPADLAEIWWALAHRRIHG
ncbi:PucR family transcriptional regulator [Streptantibioticus rubrisoli]|uniref:Helix-turn-helix domain-containing protein n=1 Tax=Streptantibioticus rubrisoli TaxID=1387313 RepID=A0ABT1P830_9ACTN|nr:PucR family transcriptional regulator [Streptantibioticus rubrisoli]MCQ4041531.1 helix-turn-helix domain-containing protein [Streptantibioticus rubrisoli]